MVRTHGGQFPIKFCNPLDHQMGKSPVNVVVGMAPLLGAACLP
jgi:hypothetical protein